jgi:DNA-binding transcriptional ArsR family regulator
MKQLSEHIYVDTAPALETFVAMFRVHNHEQLLPRKAKYASYVDGELEAWVAEARKQLSEEMKQELDVFFNFESYLGLTISIRLLREGHYKDIEDSLHYMEQFPAAELVRDFTITGYAPDERLEDVSNAAQVQAYLKKLNLPEHEKWKLFYLVCDADQTKQRFVSLVRSFHDLFLAKTSLPYRERDEDSVLQLEEMVQTYGINKVYELFDDPDVVLNSKKVLLIPSYFHHTSNIVSAEHGPDLIQVYGTKKLPMLLEQGRNEEEIFESIKVLADEKRLRMIQLLNKAPRYGYELAQELNLSNSTISHHLSTLVSNGFIQALRKENKVYYKVNHHEIKSVLQDVERLLTLP